jgi:DNA-binding NarL/FixJ family response regulator
MKQLINGRLQVIKYIAEGDTNKQIALKLHVSEETVRPNTTGLMKNLNARNRAHAVATYDRIPRDRTVNNLIRYLTTPIPQHMTTGPN